MDKQQKQLLTDKINTKSWTSSVQKSIIDDCYKFFYIDESQWKKYYDDDYYIIGLSEDKYDYYWICVNKDLKLKFITCLFKFNENDISISKNWSQKETKNILEKVKKYFLKYSDKENLIYLDEKLYK